MSEKVLFVDDEQVVLDTFRRSFRKQLSMEFATSGREALEMMENAETPFAVIMCDQQMPGLAGSAVLSEVSERWPDTVRLMLTGRTDVTTAVEAVNAGRIFRFLTKPCPPQTILNAVEAALEQHRLITAEKELLNKTLRGSVEVLTEILNLTTPVASGKSTRIQRYAMQIVKELKLEDEWQYDLAAMLSQIGCITLPGTIIDKVFGGEKLSLEEESLFRQHPIVAKKLIANIPRLRTVAYMISTQLNDFEDFAESKQTMPFVIGGQIIRIANDFDTLILQGMKQVEAILQMEKLKGAYDPAILNALRNVNVENVVMTMRTVNVEGLHTRMVFNQDVTAKNGIVLVSKGIDVTSTVISMLKSFKDGIGVIEPIRVMVYS